MRAGVRQYLELEDVGDYGWSICISREFESARGGLREVMAGRAVEKAAWGWGGW